MIVKYINSKKETFILNKGYDCAIKACDPYESSWIYESVKLQYGINITSFGKDPIILPIVLKYRGTRQSIDLSLENFFRACETDIINMTPGQLWIGDQYLSGYFVERSTVNASEYYGREQTLSFLSPYGFWLHQEKRSFYPQAVDPSASSGLDYNYDYNYDYAAETGSGVQWYIDHFAPSEFEMIIYGPAVNPLVNINGHTYQIFDTLENGEYVIINSENNTVMKYRSNGTTKNIFDLRGKEESIFEPISGGQNVFSWNGSFGFDLTLFLERSEPKW